MSDSILQTHNNMQLTADMQPNTDTEGRESFEVMLHIILFERGILKTLNSFMLFVQNRCNADY